MDDKLARVIDGEEYLVLDGGMGTMLQRCGLAVAGAMPDLLNFSHPEAITAIHAAYVSAGAQAVTTNTFGSNSLKLEGTASVEEIYCAAASCARASGARYVAGDIGPIGTLLKPLGTLSFSEAYELFAEQVRAICRAGCDIILIETLSDLREAKAALLAAKDHGEGLPVFVSMTFGEDGRTFLGTTPEIAAVTLSSMGANAVGVNCSLGPDALLPVVESFVRVSRCPVLVQPNAGLPHMEGETSVYDVDAASFVASMQRILDAGASIVGGCCGTDPIYIEGLAAAVAEHCHPVSRQWQQAFYVTSAQEVVRLNKDAAAIVVIGERINPTGKPRLKEALASNNLDYVIGEAVSQQEAGADLLDVNVGAPGLDEPAVLAAVVDKLQATMTLPLQIDSSDPVAIEAAVREYAGKPLVNSVNGKRESLEAVLPIVRRYGCSVVGLTLDEEGIPPTAEGRLAIAERIVEEAEAYGIPRCDVAIDCLAMAVAAGQQEAYESLRAISLVKERLGVRTVLGVSNVSFGMPQRGLMNATFLAAAFGAGLDMPILNPLSARYRDTVAAFRVLNGQDKDATSFVEHYAQAPDPYQTTSANALPVAVGGSAMTAGEGASLSGASDGSLSCNDAAGDTFLVPAALADVADEARKLAHLVLRGRAEAAAAVTEFLLKDHSALDVIDGVFIPALDDVGVRYEAGEFFLPQLMASAEAVKAGFEVVRARATQDGEAISKDESRTVLLATVKGDIHDIGKNIVRMLLENYGYHVVDLGRDVDPDLIVQTVREQGIRLVGLSALMTTTVKAMEKTITLLREQAPGVSVLVGGAVLTPEYARAIGADYYGKDAAETARIVGRFFDNLNS